MTTADRYAVLALAFFVGGLVAFLFFEWTALRVLAAFASMGLGGWFGKLSERAMTRAHEATIGRPLVRPR